MFIHFSNHRILLCYYCLNRLWHNNRFSLGNLVIRWRLCCDYCWRLCGFNTCMWFFIGRFWWHWVSSWGLADCGTISSTNDARSLKLHLAFPLRFIPSLMSSSSAALEITAIAIRHDIIETPATTFLYKI
jgi:hypothetical protein